MNIPNIKSIVWGSSLALLTQCAWALDSKNVDLAAKQIQVSLIKLSLDQYETAQEHITAALSHLEVASRDVHEKAVYDLSQQKLKEGMGLLKNNKSKEASAALQKSLDLIKTIR